MRGLWLAVPAALALLACSTDLRGVSTGYRHDAAAQIEVTMPAGAQYISQQFYRPKGQDRALHQGIDVKGPAGTLVLAAAPGVVVTSLYEPFYGNRIRIDHGIDDKGRRVFTKYYHLKARGAKVGDRVSRGQRIATMGSTGALGAAVHLHFETHLQPPGGRPDPVDPHRMWAGGVGRVSCFEPETADAIPPWRMTYPTPCL